MQSKKGLIRLGRSNQSRQVCFSRAKSTLYGLAGALVCRMMPIIIQKLTPASSDDKAFTKDTLSPSLSWCGHRSLLASCNTIVAMQLCTTSQDMQAIPSADRRSTA